jgi:hypothetical protein
VSAGTRRQSGLEAEIALALSHFRTENRIPPLPEFIIGRAFGRTRWRGHAFFLKMF